MSAIKSTPACAGPAAGAEVVGAACPGAAEHRQIRGSAYRRPIAEELHIPESVRTALLDRLERSGISAVKLGQEFLMNEGHGSFDDYIGRVGELYGDAEADRARRRMNELAARDSRTIGGGSGLDRAYRQRVIAQNLARYALIAGPDAEFLKGIEYALGTFGALFFDSGGPLAGYEESTAYLAWVDELFAKRGIPYRVEDHKIVWAGDRGPARPASRAGAARPQ